MANYAYSPELRAPGNWAGLDFADPKLRSAVKIMVRSLNEKVSAFAAPSGVKMTTVHFTSDDGTTLPCYAFEPDSGDIVGNMLYCHGGGFFLPVQPMMAELACIYASRLSVRVYLPEYRILPEYANPYPFTDCRAVLDELVGQDLPYILYGESVGGTIAAGLSIWTRNDGKRQASGQCLIYPVLDNVCSKYPSMRQYSEAAWPLKNNLTMWTEYLNDGMKLDPEYLIPMKAADLGNLPQAYIEPQEIDILRDEAAAYARRLSDAGNKVTLNIIPGSYHGFDEDTENPFVRSVIEERIEQMKQMLNRRNDFGDDRTENQSGERQSP